MNLREAILAEHSKKQVLIITQWVGGSQTKFDKLYQLFLNDEYRVVQRAAWAVCHCIIDRPQLIKKHLKSLLTYLHKKDLPEAVKRNTMRILQHVEVPKKYRGLMMEFCFGAIASPQESIAVKAYSLTLLQTFVQLYPEILPEIKLIIEQRMPHETAAFRARAKKILNQPARKK